MKQYLIYGWDGAGDDAMERRLEARPSHFENARRMKALGNFIFDGVIPGTKGKMIGANMLMQFETEKGLHEWLEKKPYLVIMFGCIMMSIPSRSPMSKVFPCSCCL
jgi:uncharacterized protein